jgi:hypothetical protein
MPTSIILTENSVNVYILGFGLSHVPDKDSEFVQKNVKILKTMENRQRK